MEQQGKKKEWATPELLVLVRSHPEEAVLTACKFFTASPGQPEAANGWCALNVPLCATTCELGAPS